jgi:uncharacterized protein YndB with AHSA1/START domain
LTVDESKRRRRRGPAPLEAGEKREHTVSVRLNPDELTRLDQARGTVGMQRGEYLRAAALHRLPPTIPALNREAWAALSRSAANLNQIAHRLNLADQDERAVAPSTTDVARVLADFRRALIGADLQAVGDEG